jgi:hypothetical protein
LIFLIQQHYYNGRYLQQGYIPTIGSFERVMKIKLEGKYEK